MAYNRKEEYLAVVKQPKEISDTLLETIDYIAKARDAELSFDKTIIAEIVSLNNADTGEYFVEYQKGKFRAYAPIGLTYVYSKGTNVYVKIPGGDFTQKKTIEGKASANSQTKEEYTALTQQIIDIGEVFTDGNEYGVLAYAQPTDKYYEQVIYENKEMSEDIIFTSLLNTYPNIMISADFKTNFYGTTVAGNYGLKIEFEEKDTGITYTRFLDITNFSGSIYGYDIYSPQYVIYNLSGFDLIGIKKITFFQERFLHYDEVKNSNDEIIKVYDSESNIFVQNIKINFVELQDSSKDLYYIGISAPQGLSLIQDTDKVKLSGVLYYANKNVLDKKNCQCYWYKLNPAILSGDTKYDKLAGPGWEYIDSNNDNVDFNELTVSGKDVYQEMWYKLVIVYNSTTTLYKEIRVVKYYNERFTIIRQDVSDTEVKLQIVDGQDKIDKADWYVDLLDGSYQLLATDTNEIDISKYLNYGDVIFYTVSKLDDEGNYVPCRYQLKTYMQEAPVRIIFDGNDTFQYDKNGSISYDQSIAEIVIKPNITVDKENIGIKSITWYSPDGGELFEYPTTRITNSMLTKLWIDKGTNSLHYNIRQKYVSNYTNNTLSLRVITLAGKEFSFTKSIIFSKQGEYDINGLDYSLAVIPCDETGNEVKSRSLNKNSGDTNFTPIFYKAVLRLNGNIIKNGDTYKGANDEDVGTYNIATSAKGINIKCESQDNIIKVSDIVTDKQGQYFLKVSVSVGLNDKDTVKSLNYYQPIMVSYGMDYQKINSYNIPSRIVYGSDGSPNYSSAKELSFKYNRNELVNMFITSLTNNLFINKTTDNNVHKYYLIPTSNFEGAYFADSTDATTTKPMGALYLRSLDGNIKIYIPIVMLNERDSLISDMDEDDGTNVPVIDEDDPEQTKPLMPWLSHGNLNHNQGSTVIGTEWARKVANKSQIATYANENESGYVSGLYQYDIDNIPTNILRSDGVVRLGGDKLLITPTGQVELNENVDSNILTVARLLNEIANNTDLKNQLSDYIAPKNIKVRTWYTEE